MMVLLLRQMAGSKGPLPSNKRLEMHFGPYQGDVLLCSLDIKGSL